MGKNSKNKEAGQVFILSIFLGLVILSILNIVSAQTSTTCDLNISLVNQDPYPAIPDSYVTAVFQVSGVDNSNCAGARVQLLPSYPFSLDGNDSLRTLDGNTWVAGYKNEWMVPYKIRVDKDALDGVSQIQIGYAVGNDNPNSYIIKKFDITIKDSRTDFDAVIQDVSSSDVSIALANAGKNTANSVVVRIPQQEYFIATGTDGQMVGNLASGDYTIVSFSVSAIGARTAQRGANSSNRTIPSAQQQAHNLKFDIYYTDNLGERRVVNMELPVRMSTNSSMMGIFSGNRVNGRNSSSIWSLSNWYIWAILLVIVIASFVLYKKRKHAKEASKNHNGKPEWVNNAKEKGKRK